MDLRTPRTLVLGEVQFVVCVWTCLGWEVQVRAFSSLGLDLICWSLRKLWELLAVEMANADGEADVPLFSPLTELWDVKHATHTRSAG